MSGIGFVGGGGSGAAVVLGQSAVAVPLTGTLVETVLASVVIPAGAMGKNGQIDVEAMISQTNNANGKSLFFKFGALTVLAFGTAGFAGFGARRRIANRNAVNAQVTAAAAFVHEYQALNAAQVGAVDTSQAVTLNISAQLTNVADTVTLESWRVLMYPRG